MHVSVLVSVCVCACVCVSVCVCMCVCVCPYNVSSDAEAKLESFSLWSRKSNIPVISVDDVICVCLIIMGLLSSGPSF